MSLFYIKPLSRALRRLVSCTLVAPVRYYCGQLGTAQKYRPDAEVLHGHSSAFIGDPMAYHKSRFLRAVGTGVGFLVMSTAVVAQTFIGPTPYLSKNDSPFLASINAGTTFLETFESGALATPGVTVSAGSVIGPGGLTDSVDADDGAIDGSGTNGHSFFSGAGSTGITFTFDANVLGALPTQVGIVWTDGQGTTLFEAFGPGGVPLGRLVRWRSPMATLSAGRPKTAFSA